MTPTQDVKLIPEGKYPGKIVDYSISQKSDNSEPVLEVMFELDVSNLGKRKLTLYKYFKGNALEYTLKFLATVGMRGNDPGILVDNHYGTGTLDETSDFEVEVIQETYEGKVRNKIGWVNRRGTSKVGGAQAMGLKQKLGDLRGPMMKARKDANIPDSKPAESKPKEQATASDAADPSSDDCPF